MDLYNCCFRAKMLNDYEITNVKTNTKTIVCTYVWNFYFLKATLT